MKDRREMSQFFKSDLQKEIENIMGAILANTVSENFTELMKTKNIYAQETHVLPCKIKENPHQDTL